MSAYAEIDIAKAPIDKIAVGLLDAALVPAGARLLVRVGRQPVDLRGVEELRRHQARGVRVDFSGHPQTAPQWRLALDVGFDSVSA